MNTIIEISTLFYISTISAVGIFTIHDIVKRNLGIMTSVVCTLYMFIITSPVNPLTYLFCMIGVIKMAHITTILTKDKNERKGSNNKK